jgi:predicted kinase
MPGCGYTPRVLVILSGLPGTGKTTIARELARVMPACHLRIDSIEAPMFAAGWNVEGVGYAVAQAVAEDNLRLGAHVIADCVNPWPITRDAWREVARSADVQALEVEIVCSDRGRDDERH